MSNYVAVCVAPDGSAITVPLSGSGAHTPGGTACTSYVALEMIQAVDGSDGSVGGIGVVACGGTGEPACQNSVATGTTACGLPGMVSCTATASSTSTPDAAPALDAGTCLASWSLGFMLPLGLYIFSHFVGQMLKMIRDA